MDFIELHRNFSKLVKNLPSILMGGFLKHENELIESNQKQLRQGKRSDDSKIVPEYSVDYERIKAKEGSISTPNPDLYRRGGYYASISLTHPQDEYIQVESDAIVGNFDLATHLEERYNEKILGVPDEQLEKTGLIVVKEQKETILNELR